jgi:outer membrane receptor protein involved in Fe transport
LRVTQLQTTGNTNFVIRGFGNGANNPGIEPSVGVFIDGVYRSRSAAALADLPNVERVEVLRGPQSTLFGKNASAGVINVITAAPDMDSIGGSASLVYGNLNQVIVKGDISGPISDTFGFSLSANVNQRDGYFENLSNGSLLNERDRWGVRGQLLWLPTDSISLRLIADTEEISETCCGVGNIAEQFPFPGGVIRALGGPFVGDDVFAREQYYNFDPVNDIKNSGVSLQADFDFANEMLITSITAYREQTRDEDADSDFSNADLLGRNVNDTDIETFTQELRLSQSLDSLDWMIGGYYFDESVSYVNDLRFGTQFRTYGDFATGGTPPTFADSGLSLLEVALAPLGIQPGTFFAPGTGVVETTGQDDQTFSIFGQFDWLATDTVTITLGANYTKVEKDASISQTNSDVFSGLDLIQVGFGGIFTALTGLPPTPANIAANPAEAGQANALSMIPCDGTNEPFCNPVSPMQPLQFLPPFVDYPNVVEPGTSSDSATTWTARIAWDVTDEINLYASAGTGFKATSWNLSRDSRPFASDIPALDAAGLTVNNLVPGTRYAGPEDSTVYELGFKGRWGANYLNIAVFDQEIEGFQSNIFTGTGFILTNAGKQSTTGVELDTVWVPTDPLSIAFSLTWLDPLYDSFEVSSVGDLTGTRPAGIPEWSTVTSGIYDFEIGASMNGFIRAEYIYESEVQVVENVPEDVASRKVSVVNASAGIGWDNGMEIMIWGRNLTEDDYLLSAFPTTVQNFPPPGSISGYPNQPRTYGITLRARFD